MNDIWKLYIIYKCNLIYIFIKLPKGSIWGCSIVIWWLNNNDEYNKNNYIDLSKIFFFLWERKNEKGDGDAQVNDGEDRQYDGEALQYDGEAK